MQIDENEMGWEYSSYSLDRHRPSWRLAEVAWDPGRLNASILAFLNRLSHGAIPWERFNWPKKRPHSRRGYVLIFFSSSPFPLVVFRSSSAPSRLATLTIIVDFKSFNPPWRELDGVENKVRVVVNFDPYRNFFLYSIIGRKVEDFCVDRESACGMYFVNRLNI